jgi:hypothetical protein
MAAVKFSANEVFDLQKKGAVMRNTIAYPTQRSSSPSRGIACSHKRGNNDRVTAV